MARTETNPAQGHGLIGLFKKSAAYLGFALAAVPAGLRDLVRAGAPFLPRLLVEAPIGVIIIARAHAALHGLNRPEFRHVEP